MADNAAQLVDLRGLQPPQPMLEILRRISGPAVGPLEVLLPHVPIPLLPELDERGWSYRVVAFEPGCCHVRLDPPENP